MMGFGFLGMFLFWGALLALLAGGGAWALRQATGASTPGRQSQPTPHQILDGRFARGEIDREEYEAIRARLDQ